MWSILRETASHGPSALADILVMNNFSDKRQLRHVCSSIMHILWKY